MMQKFLCYSIKEYLFCYISLLFLVLYWGSAYGLPYEAIHYSIIISVIAGFLIIANIVQSVLKFRKLLEVERQENSGEGVEKKRWDCSLGMTKKRVAILVCTLLYPILLDVVGFFPLSVIYLIGSAVLLGIRNWKILIPYAVGFSVALYLIFDVWLGVTLPAGMIMQLF